MPTLPTQSFQTIVQNTIIGMQGRASKLINFAIGSVLRAIAEGFGGLFLWFQALVLQLLTAIRLSTSSGTDVDTFCADYMPIIPGSQTAALPSGSPRLGAQAATGQVTFSRFTAAPSTCFIPVGATVQTKDGSQSYAVTADTTYATFSSALNGYTLAAAVASIIVPVQAAVPGSAGNVQAGEIGVMTSPVTGIDTVTNAVAFSNGFDFESDTALKNRFPLFIASLAKGTEGAFAYAVASVQQNMQIQIFENVDLGGATDYGMVTVFVDDGSGSPPPALVQACYAAIFTPMRACGVRLGVYTCSVLSANVTASIATAAGYYHPDVVAAVAAALGTYINSVGLGNTLSYGKLFQVIFNASPGVTDVTNMQLNGLTSDLVPGMGQSIKAGALIIS